MPASPNLHASASAAAVSQVLLIDGRPGRVEMLTIALSESWEDLTVQAVADVPAATALVMHQQEVGSRPTLIVVAHAEPSTAIDRLRQLKADAVTAEVPVLLVCPQLASSDYQRSARLGAIEMLREPESLDGYLRLAAGWQRLLARA
jgi:CheY-like chemotaxis protein